MLIWKEIEKKHDAVDRLIDNSSLSRKLCNEWADLLMKKRIDDEITKKQVSNTIIIIAHDAALI